MTLEHGGILLVVLGTILLAYALKIGNKYTESNMPQADKNFIVDILERAKNDHHEPSIVTIRKFYFYVGLACVAPGSLLQW